MENKNKTIMVNLQREYGVLGMKATVQIMKKHEVEHVKEEVMYIVLERHLKCCLIAPDQVYVVLQTQSLRFKLLQCRFAVPASYEMYKTLQVQIFGKFQNNDNI